MQTFSIDHRSLGAGHPCFIIAEVAQAHDGSLGMAHSYIDAIAGTGADAVKFQTHLADAESTLHEPWRVRFSRQDRTRFEYWKRMEFTPEQWQGLRDHARESGLVFLSSPFSVEAVDLLENLGVPAWKVASGEVNNPLLLEALAATGKPALLSTGMCSLGELDEAVQLFRQQGCPIAIFQCTTAYPCPAERTGLDMLENLRARYHCPVGLSDHSGAIFASLAAATLGANLVEVHVTLSREMFGPDVVASLTTAELRQLATGIRFVEQALQATTDKDRQAAELSPLRKTFGKSLITRQPLTAGTILGPEHLTAKKPGIGIPAAEYRSVIGKQLLRELDANEFLQPEYLADAG